MQVAILGCGPSGLLAAHAAVRLGHDPVIYSIKQKSPMHGAMYLHEQIPGMSPSLPDGAVHFKKIGTREGYAEKVYGSPGAPCSWDQFPTGEYPAWSMSDLYGKLWDEYSSAINDTPLDQPAILGLQACHSLVISSVPAHVLCESPDHHRFVGQHVWIIDREYRELEDGDILYNGDASDHWYRSSVIFGHGATESVEYMPGAFGGVKPVSTDCNCHPDVKRVGRFGQWKKGVLVHHAYGQAMEEIEWALGGAIV